eukprot:8030592-Alexandrium_andersonii.AAC.1
MLKVQSTIRSRPVSAAIRLNPQSVLTNMHNRFRRSDLELRGPRSVLEVGPRSSRQMRSAMFSSQVPNPLPDVGP